MLTCAHPSSIVWTWAWGWAQELVPVQATVGFGSMQGRGGGWCLVLREVLQMRDNNTNGQGFHQAWGAPGFVGSTAPWTVSSTVRCPYYHHHLWWALCWCSPGQTHSPTCLARYFRSHCECVVLIGRKEGEKGGREKDSHHGESTRLFHRLHTSNSDLISPGLMNRSTMCPCTSSRGSIEMSTSANQLDYRQVWHHEIYFLSVPWPFSPSCRFALSNLFIVKGSSLGSLLWDRIRIFSTNLQSALKSSQKKANFPIFLLPLLVKPFFFFFFFFFFEDSLN